MREQSANVSLPERVVVLGLGNLLRGDQTVMIPPGGAVMVQLTVPQAGLYPFVTHSFVDVGKGALGTIKVTP